MEQIKQCTDCKEAKSLSQFYLSKTHSKGVMCYCKDCFNKRCSQRWIKRKIEAIHYKGAACERCKLHLSQTHYSVYEFHHLDPAQKDVEWVKLRLKSLIAIKKELDKCILLCANCHRVVHSLDFPEQSESR